MRRSIYLPWFALTLSASSLAGAGPPANNQYEDGVVLTISTKPFDSKKHKIEKCGGEMACTDDSGKLKKCEENICGIDGKPLYGAYGKIPKEEVASLIFEKDGRKIALDVSGMYNPNVNNSNIKKYIKLTPWNEKDTYHVTGYFSHDDGDDDMYVCLWLVWPGGSIRNYMGDFEALDGLTTRVKEDFNYVTLQETMKRNSRREE